MARIPYPDMDALPQALRELARTRLPLNIYRMLMHAETAMPGFVALGRGILHELSLDPTLRELAILRVGHLCRSRYEVHQHERLGRAVGVRADQLAALAEGPDAPAFSELERLVLRFTDEVVGGVRASDAIFDALVAELSHRQVVELVITIGFYLMACRVLENLDVDIEPEDIVPADAFEKFYGRSGP